MNGKIRLVLVLALAMLITGLVMARAPATPVSASPGDWTITCKSVLDADRGLWFDSASPGVNNEGGFFWINNHLTSDETCTASAKINPSVSTDKYPKLRVIAAVNDRALFTVQVFKLNPVGGVCNVLVSTIRWSAADVHSGFMTKTAVLPKSTSICMVKMTLTDNPDSTSILRTNAMIDEVRIWDGANTGWVETFTVTPP